jgi:hypothetical protein
MQRWTVFFYRSSFLSKTLKNVIVTVCISTLKKKTVFAGYSCCTLIVYCTGKTSCPLEHSWKVDQYRNASFIR